MSAAALVLRGCQFVFTLISFSILAAADGNLTAFSTGRFLLAAGIIAFIFSFVAIVAGIAAVASSSLRDKQSRMYLFFAVESFLNVCLLFGAACTGANVFGESCGYLSNQCCALVHSTYQRGQRVVRCGFLSKLVLLSLHSSLCSLPPAAAIPTTL
ncbi:unnamed protein product [Closterium sp. NIES-54]